MSDAMSAIEIEDVLSSIRRLVSEDLRPAAVKPAEPAALLLTPALRVVPKSADDTWEEEDWANLPVEAQLSPSGWSLPEAEPEPAELDVPLALPMQPASVRLTAVEASAPAPLPPHRFTLTQAARVLPTESPEAPAPWDQTADAPLDEGEAAAPAEDALAEDTLATTAAEQTWADQAAREAIAGIEAGEDVAADGATDFAKASAPPFDDPLQVISETDPAFQDEDAGTTQDDAENEARNDAENDPAEPGYDEVMLRELVRDILREELSGALGEKITRNVRKLVRAEIAQALVTRDLR